MPPQPSMHYADYDPCAEVIIPSVPHGYHPHGSNIHNFNNDYQPHHHHHMSNYYNSANSCSSSSGFHHMPELTKLTSNSTGSNSASIYSPTNRYASSPSSSTMLSILDSNTNLNESIEPAYKYINNNGYSTGDPYDAAHNKEMIRQSSAAVVTTSDHFQGITNMCQLNKERVEHISSKCYCNYTCCPYRTLMLSHIYAWNVYVVLFKESIKFHVLMDISLNYCRRINDQQQPSSHVFSLWATKKWETTSQAETTSSLFADASVGLGATLPTATLFVCSRTGDLITSVEPLRNASENLVSKSTVQIEENASNRNHPAFGRKILREASYW